MTTPVASPRAAPRHLHRVAGWTLVLACAAVWGLPAVAQDSREAQRRLDAVKRELRTVAGERRKVEGERGAATRALRDVDEQVGRSMRALRETEAAIAARQKALAALVARRDALGATMAGQRAELATLLRATYAVGTAPALKLLLSQDQVAEANRRVAYHGYLQRHRSARIATLSHELAQLDALEREVARERTALDARLADQRTQVAALERDRRERADAVSGLDRSFADRRAREQALGRDAKSLERVLAQLRAAARRAEAGRRAAEAREARAAAAAAGTSSPPTTAGPPRTPRPPPVAVTRTAPVQVGGLGWPLSGALLARFGGKLPDGRSSSGVLIGAAPGAPVQAVADGTVVFSEWMTGYGLILIVDHGNGYMSLYAHNDALLKDAGDSVRRGDAVASVGNSGGQGRPGLYFELRRDGQPVDPTSWLQRR